MKKILFILFLYSLIIIPQTKTWQQSTLEQFASGTLNNVMITNTSGGELQLIHPLIRQTNDTLDSSIPEFVSFDDEGNYVAGWVNNGRVYVQKFNSEKKPLTVPVIADDSGNVPITTVNLAVLNDGKFVVGWNITNYILHTSYRYLQFFDPSGEKIGRNQLVLNVKYASSGSPVPIADKVNNRYFILTSERVDTNNTYHLFGNIYSSIGNLLQGPINMIPTGGTKFELYPNGNFSNGKLAITWEGNNKDSGPGDIYTALYDSNCIPITTPILVAQQRTTGSLAFDNNGNFCVTWVLNTYFFPGPPEQIFAQAFDSSGTKLGSIIQITNLKQGQVYRQKITFNNNIFRIGWTNGFSDGRATQLWNSYWKIEQIKDGSYISSAFDAGNPNNIFRSLTWNASISNGTQIKFQLRSSSTMEGINSASWRGPTSDSDYYMNSSGETINSKINPSRYLQVKILFHSSTTGNSPVLKDFCVSFISSDTIPPLPPLSVKAISGHRNVEIEWEKSKSQDVRFYRIYKSIGKNYFDKNSFIEVDAERNSFIDSSVVYDQQYHYAVTVVDSSFNESTMTLTELSSPHTMIVFVSTQGSPQGNGSAAKPFSKINDGIEFAGVGDTVFVYPGDYNENVKLKDMIALIGSNASNTKILSSNTDYILTTGVNNLIKGFTFNCTQGLNCGGDSATISENIFLGSANGFDGGIRTNFHKGIIISKNIIRNFLLGIQVESHSEPVKLHARIRNNIIIDCGTCVRNIFGNIEITNNTFIIENSGGAGVVLAGGNPVIMNNCFAGYPTWGILVRSLSFGPDAVYSFQYNNVWNCNGDKDNLFSSPNISADPQFKNLVKNNFHLSPASGCIDKGNPAKEYNDIDDTQNDIGAYGGPDPLPNYLSFSLATGILINNVSGFPGDTVSVDIGLTNAAGLERAEINIQSDNSVMSFLQAVPAQLLNGFSLTTEQPSANLLTIKLNGQNEIISVGGNILTLKFILNPAIQFDRQCAIEFGNVNLYDGEGEKIYITFINNGSCIIQSNAVYLHKVFVDGRYQGISDGTLLHPYTTIQKGIDNAKPGDTVSVASGIYSGPLSLRSNIFVLGLGANTTTIQSPDNPLSSTSAIVRFNNVDSAGISGFSIVNNSSLGPAIQVTSSNALILNNKIDQCGPGMYSITTDSSSRVFIHDNYFVSSKMGGLATLNIMANRVIISRNVFSAFGPELLQVHFSHNAIINNNRFYLAEGSRGLTGYNTVNMIVANNLFSGSSSYGIALNLMNSDSTLILNNIFDIKSSGITENNGTQQLYNNIFVGNNVALNLESNTKHEYNLFWNNNLNIGKGNVNSTEFTADPRFVNQQEGNYKIEPISPARDAGNPSSKWNDNDGTRNDIGLYGGPYADNNMFAAINSKLRIENVHGKPGDTILVPLYALGITGISGIQILLTFDSERLTLVETHSTTNTQEFVLMRKNFGNSTVELTLVGHHPIVLDSGAVMELKFVINKNASGNIPLSFQNVLFVAASSQIIQGVNFENGEIILSFDAVDPDDQKLARAFALFQNYPNPFNPTTIIQYQIPQSGNVILNIYDILGRKVRTLVNQYQTAGEHSVNFDGRNLSSGIYLYQLKSNAQSITKKLILLK